MSKAKQIIQMGIRVTQGLGAGSQPEVGRAAAEEVINAIRDHLTGSHMVFVTAGMKATVTYTIVTAQPGWFLAIFANSGVRYEQIIAWEIRRTTSRNGLVSRSPIPITAESNNGDLVCTDWAIKGPDGRVVLHSNDMSAEVLSRIAPRIEFESLKFRVGSPSIADELMAIQAKRAEKAMPDSRRRMNRNISPG